MSAPSDRIADCLKLSRPAHSALAHAGIVSFADLSAWTRRAVEELHGIGPKSFVELDPAMTERGLEYRA